MKAKYKRSRILVDPPFQVRLMIRLAALVILYTVAIIHVTFVLELFTIIATDDIRKGFWTLYIEYLTRQRALLLTFVMILPVLLYDILLFSHRIAGPLFRCRHVMREMAEGKVVREFVPRKHDLMGELFAAFNLLIRRCNSQLSTDTISEAACAAPPVAPTAEAERKAAPPEAAAVN